MKCLVLLLAIGCANETDDAGVPVEPNGANGASRGFTTVHGRICIGDDLVEFRRCRTTDLAGFIVEVENNIAITDEAGAFRVRAPTSTLPTFIVRGRGAITTRIPFTPSLVLPVVDADVFARTLAANQIVVPARTGAILGRVMHAGVPALGVTVRSTPVSLNRPLYDANGPGFAIDATGLRGVFFVSGIAEGAAGLTFDNPLRGETTVAGVQVVNGGVTILDSLVLP